MVNQFLKILLAHFHNNVGVHLDKSSVAVPSPAWVVRLFSNYVYYCLVQSKVQDRVHHTWHGSTCSGTNGYKKRILFISKFLSSNLFHLNDVFVDLSLDLIVDLTVIFIVLCTCFCCNRKSLWYRKTKAGHLSKVCTFSAEEFTHVCVTFTEQINPFVCHVYKFLLNLIIV